MKILAVDDDEIMLELLSTATLAAGYDDVTTASSGVEALQILKKSTDTFDCFLLDVKMPGMDGIELCDEIRKHQNYDKTPIIMITGATETESAERAFEAGATDYVAKPFDIFELGHRIKIAETHIGDMQRAQQSVERVETRFRDLKNITSDWFWEQDENCRFVDDGIAWETPFLNGIGKQFVGQTRWEVAGVDPDEDEYWKLHVEDLAARRSFRDFQYCLVDLNGEEHFVSVSGKPVIAESGKFEGYRGTVSEITDLVYAQNANDRFLHALDYLSEGLILWDNHEKYVFGNNALRNILGPVADVLRTGLSFEDWMHEHVKHAPSKDIENDENSWSSWVSENTDRFRNPIGEYEVFYAGRWQVHRFEKLPDGYTMQSIRDIHNTKLNEDALQQSQRLQAVGQLTGGIAHDFNNLLSIMLGNVELIEDLTDGDDITHQCIDALYVTINRATSLISRIMAFSRQQNLSPVATSIENMIQELTTIFQRMLGATITLHTNFEPNIGFALVDVPQFENALLNLVVNAQHAMHAGGSLTIDVSSYTQTSANSDQGEVLDPGDYISVSVTDTGVGMPLEVVNRVFEPFFTTKGVGEGNGLGLSMVFGFIRQSNGHITINSEVGQGTVVNMYLPKSTSIPVAVSQPDTTPVPKQMAKLVLLVEDDEAVGKIAADVLTKNGYEVRIAVDGIEAVKLLNSELHFDLLFTDIVLPNGMSGLEVSDKAVIIQPHIKLLFTSGYAREEFAKSIHSKSDTHLLGKPYRRAELLKVVKNILDSN